MKATVVLFHNQTLNTPVLLSKYNRGVKEASCHIPPPARPYYYYVFRERHCQGAGPGAEVGPQCSGASSDPHTRIQVERHCYVLFQYRIKNLRPGWW